MGTINFKTNNILITLCKDIFNNINDDEIKAYKEDYEEANDVLITIEEAQNLYYEDLNDLQYDEFIEIASLIKNYNFNYYEVKIEGGYYEGYQLLIDNNYNYFDNYKEKKENQKELTTLKKLMLNLINNYNMLICYPGWCDSWLDKKESLKKLNESIKEERTRIKNTPYYDKKYYTNIKNWCDTNIRKKYIKN